MTPTTTPLRTDLAALVGPPSAAFELAACAAFAVDGKTPDCTVAPAAAEQVAAVLSYARDHQLAVIARGSGTKLGVGNLPRRYDVALSLREMRRVVHHEPADLTISVEAGMTLGEFQDVAGRSGLWLPLDPRGGREASIGGIIAANASGPLRQGFGGPRDMVLGLKIATTEGTIVKTGGRVVKNVAGYDLGKLMTGSFGTLGVIVEACLKLFPKPPERATFAMRAGNLGMARDLRRRILRSPLDPMRLVLLDATAASLLAVSSEVKAKPETDLWVEVGGTHRVIARCLAELQQLATAAGASLVAVEGADEAWARISSPVCWLLGKYPALIVLKAALPIVASEEFLSRAQQEAEAERVAVAGFAQVGVGIIQLCLLPEALSESVDGLVSRLRHAAADFGGTLVIEHCPVELKRRVDVWGTTCDDLGAMRKIKLLWDPKDVLAPGRFLGGI